MRNQAGDEAGKTVTQVNEDSLTSARIYSKNQSRHEEPKGARFCGRRRRFVG